MEEEYSTSPEVKPKSSDLDELTKAQNVLFEEALSLRTKAWKIVSALENKPLEEDLKEVEATPGPQNKILKQLGTIGRTSAELMKINDALARIRDIIGGD